MKWALPVILGLIMIIPAASLPGPAAAQSGVIQIIPDPEMIGPGTKVTVLIFDSGLDAHSNRVDEYEAEDIELVTFATDRSEVEEGVPDLEETGENTGIFEFTIQLMTDEESCDNDRFTDDSFEAQSGSEPSIGVCPGDILSIEYEDPLTASGDEGIFSSSVEIRSWDPEFEIDGTFAIGRTSIIITDPDANRDPDIADSIRDIRVYSDRDQVGEEFSAIETGVNTGAFRLTFTTSTQPQGNAILVTESPEVSVEYTDEFPADFASAATEKTFLFSVVADSDRELLQTSAPQISTNGALAAGKQTTLSLVITNEADEPRSFVELVEVRDSDGVTVFLAWQSGTLDSQSQTQIGVLWTPDKPGDYEVRTFAISSFESSQILSQIRASEFTIQ